MARAARDAGFEVHVATRVDKGAAAIEAEGFILHRVPFRRGGLSPRAAIPTIRALRRVEQEIKPDLIHHSGLQCCVYGSIAALGTRIPQVNAITGLGYIFTSVTLRTAILRYGISAILPMLLNRRQSHVLVQNPDDQVALEKLGIDPKRIIRIPGSGVDTDVLQSLPDPEEPVTMGFAGRLLTDKGIRALVAAHAILRDKGQKINLVIAGNPDPANPASVSFEEAREWSQRPGVTWLGHIRDIRSLWRRCHIAVLPSHREGLPMSLLEAAACGRPLIATDAPGCREIAIDGQTGLLVPIENPPALADAIARLAASADLRSRYGHAARQLVVEKMSARIIGDAVVNFYKAIDRQPDVASENTRMPTGSSNNETRRRGKILLISQHYAPYPSTTSAYLTEIANDLSRKNTVLVLSGTPRSFGKPPQRAGGPTVIEIRSWWPGKGVLFSRSMAAILFAFQMFFAVLKHSRPEDAVLCVTTPFTAPYASGLAARLRKAASAIIVYDLYPHTLVMAGFVRPASMVAKMTHRANRMMFRWADTIIVIGRDMKAALSIYPETSGKTQLVTNWATLPVGYRELSTDNRFRGDAPFVVGMSGNIGFTHDANSVLEAARLLKQETSIHFLFSGEGVGWEELKARQSEMQLPNITLLERVPESDLDDFLSAANIWIIPYRKNNTGVSVPSRIYNTLAVGRPIIICSEPNAEAALLVTEHDIGWVVPPESPADLAQAIVGAASSNETIEKGRRAATIGLLHTSKPALEAYDTIMGHLLDQQTAKASAKTTHV